MSKKQIAVNECGRRIGESHPRAKLTNHEVDLIHELLYEGMSCRKVAEKMDIHFTQVARIGRGASRCQTPADVRSLDEPPAPYDPADGTDRKARAIRS